MMLSPDNWLKVDQPFFGNGFKLDSKLIETHGYELKVSEGDLKKIFW